MSSDDNDIRLALGAIQNRLRDMDEKLNRLEPLAQLAEYADKLAEELPDVLEGLITRLESDPMLGPFLAPMLTPTLRQFAEKHAELSAR